MGPEIHGGSAPRRKEAPVMAEAMHYGKTSFPVTLAPEEIAAELEPNAVELEQKTVPELVRDALAHPIDSKPLKELVKPGESVKAGQLLVLIEAMKMENEVFAPADGVVKQILAQKGALVATGDTLLVI